MVTVSPLSRKAQLCTRYSRWEIDHSDSQAELLPTNVHIVLLILVIVQDCVNREVK